MSCSESSPAGDISRPGAAAFDNRSVFHMGGEDLCDRARALTVPEKLSWPILGGTDAKLKYRCIFRNLSRSTRLSPYCIAPISFFQILLLSIQVFYLQIVRIFRFFQRCQIVFIGSCSLKISRNPAGFARNVG